MRLYSYILSMHYNYHDIIKLIQLQKYLKLFSYFFNLGSKGKDNLKGLTYAHSMYGSHFCNYL